jgi:hypothetical protein
MTRSLLTVLSLAFLLSCSILDDNEPLPAYLYVESFKFEGNSQIEGSLDQNIQHAWINVGGDFVGTWELPALIPLNYEGNFDCIFNPGIVINGISTLPEINEAMDPHRQNINLIRGQTDTIRPIARYDETTEFKLINDFDRGTHDFREDLDGNPLTALNVTNDGYSGKGGQIILSEDNPIALMTHRVDLTDIPLNSNQKFLELHYKNNIPFELGIQYYQDGMARSEYFTALNPKSSWNKVYIDYTDIIRVFEAEELRILIGAILPEGETEGNIFLDNIKFLHEN